MSDDTITFMAIICSVIAFTVGLVMWQPQKEAVASSSKAPRIIQTELPTSSPRAGDIRGDADGTKG